MKVSEFNIKDNIYRRGDYTYRVVNLIEASKDIESFKMPLECVPIGDKPWKNITTKLFAYHMKRVQDADLTYPITLDDEGYICDGWHRVVKAILNGDKFIMAKRLIVMPDCQE